VPVPRESFAAVYEIAADQFGYLTAAQARDVGVSPMALVMMERRQTLERVSRGVYRLVQFPHGPLAEYMEAALWPVAATGVISHQSALALYGVSDVNPGKIHLTIPTSYRVRRRVPDRLKLHHAQLGDDDCTLFEGIPVTTMARTIRDCHAAAVGVEILDQALIEAAREGLLLRAQAESLRKELEAPQR
jgi:predicted transcriptional regulator of viral defense system